ncbi:MAG: hypothetical protein PVF43_10980 [Candidatus Eiseniibacteriota bacterium]|jgi:hypothetical protein
MRCGKPANVMTVLIGLHQIGIVGLRDALKVELDRESGVAPADREAIVDRVIARVAEDNYLPESQREALRVAVWREYLRLAGEDVSPFFSEVAVRVRGAAGERRERFVEMLTGVFAEFELRPWITYAEPSSPDDAPELVLDDEVVVRGLVGHEAMKRAVRRRISDW